MVKYLGLAVVLALPLMLAESAQAIGHHRGCASCGGGGYAVSGGCPGGVCSVPMAAPAKMAMMDNAPPALAVTPPATPIVTTTPAQPAPNTYAMVRRGLFGRRR